MLVKRVYSIFKNTFADMDNLIAVCQMTSTANKETNFQACKTLITNAHKCGAKVNRVDGIAHFLNILYVHKQFMPVHYKMICVIYR